MSQIIKTNCTARRKNSNNRIAHNKNKNHSNNSLVSTTFDCCKGLTTVNFFDRYSRYSTFKGKGFPLQEVFSTLSNHRFDNSTSKIKNPGNQSKHRPDDLKKIKVSFFAQMEVKCSCCDKKRAQVAAIPRQKWTKSWMGYQLKPTESFTSKQDGT